MKLPRTFSTVCSVPHKAHYKGVLSLTWQVILLLAFSPSKYCTYFTDMVDVYLHQKLKMSFLFCSMLLSFCALILIFAQIQKVTGNFTPTLFWKVFSWLRCNDPAGCGQRKVKADFPIQQNNHVLK